jgi:hypothetical protein
LEETKKGIESEAIERNSIDMVNVRRNETRKK